jgi:hypothetical protein
MRRKEEWFKNILKRRAPSPCQSSWENKSKCGKRLERVKKVFDELRNSDGSVHIECSYTALQDRFCNLCKCTVDDPKYGDLVVLIKELQREEAKQAFIISSTGNRPLGIQTTNLDSDSAAPANETRKKLVARHLEQREKGKEEKKLTKNM